jgi:hypothetical protein
MRRNLYVGAALGATLIALGVASAVLEKRAVVQAAGTQAPKFEVDPMWPKPLPNHWVMGNVIGVSVDAQDHIWIIHRQGSLEAMELYGVANPPPGANKRANGKVESECCAPAPPVLCFDEAGNLLKSWGGQDGDGYVWPESNHGIFVDFKGNVWIGGNGGTPGATLPAPGGRGRAGAARGAAPPPGRAGGTEDESQPAAGRGRGRGGPPLYHDSMVLKFTQDGKFLMKIGNAGQSKGSNDTENLGRPAKLYVDPKANELYVADGYGNKRVIVFDAETGKYKRHWGAFGHVPDDTPGAGLAHPGGYNPDDPEDQQFRNPVHCAELSHDGMVYVCDRPNDRIQVFKPDGTYVKEKILYKDTLGDGSVWDIAFSKDPAQKYIYLADGANEKIHILDRESLEVVASFGDGGRQPGEFYAVHSIATDSKGNIFTTETYRGQRVQKFVYKGLGGVVKTDEGVLWPKTAKSPLQ